MKQPIDLEQIRADVAAAKEVGLTGWHVAAKAYEEYLDIVPALVDALTERDAKIERLQGLLDRAVEDMRSGNGGDCDTCTRQWDGNCPPGPNGEMCDWQWRGVSEREGG